MGEELINLIIQVVWGSELALHEEAFVAAWKNTTPHKTMADQPEGGKKKGRSHGKAVGQNPFEEGPQKLCTKVFRRVVWGPRKLTGATAEWSPKVIMLNRERPY